MLRAVSVGMLSYYHDSIEYASVWSMLTESFASMSFGCPDAGQRSAADLISRLVSSLQADTSDTLLSGHYATDRLETQKDHAIKGFT